MPLICAYGESIRSHKGNPTFVAGKRLAFRDLFSGRLPCRVGLRSNEKGHGNKLGTRDLHLDAYQLVSLACNLLGRNDDDDGHRGN